MLRFTFPRTMVYPPTSRQGARNAILHLLFLYLMAIARRVLKHDVRPLRNIVLPSRIVQQILMTLRPSVYEVTSTSVTVDLKGRIRLLPPGVMINGLNVPWRNRGRGNLQKCPNRLEKLHRQRRSCLERRPAMTSRVRRSLPYFLALLKPKAMVHTLPFSTQQAT